MNIKKFIDDNIILNSGEHIRLDCPVCGHKNTFNVSKYNGNLMWHCFHANCKISGADKYERTKNDFIKKTEYKFKLPEYINFSIYNTQFTEYIEAFKYAIINKLVDIRYDPKLNRAVFVISHNNEIVDAVGRALDKKTKPKWLRYGKSSIPFICKSNNNILTIVEDCVSACAIAELSSGLALLSTHFLDEFIKYILPYDFIIIALDKDATNTAIEISHRIKVFKNVFMLPLEKDLKYDIYQLKEFLNDK